MVNNCYKNHEPREIADRIIACEEAYINTDYNALSFEDKCRYALEYTPILHPIVAPKSGMRQRMLEELRPELLRRAEREDPFALFVLGMRYADCSAPATDEERDYLERAVRAGYDGAKVALADRFADGSDALHTQLIPEMNRLVSSGKASALELYEITSMLARRETNADVRATFYGLSREYAAASVAEGCYVALPMLCHWRTPAEHVIDELDVKEELTFWQTVDDTVYLELYRKGATHLAAALERKLMSGRGCTQDEALLERVRADARRNRTGVAD